MASSYIPFLPSDSDRDNYSCPAFYSMVRREGVEKDELRCGEQQPLGVLLTVLYYCLLSVIKVFQPFSTVFISLVTVINAPVKFGIVWRQGLRDWPQT